MIIIIMRGENFMAHLDDLGGTPVCRGTLIARHCTTIMKCILEAASSADFYNTVNCVCYMIMFFWVLAPCRLVGRCQRFGETCCLHLQG
jgi:hypothetical protein